MSVKRSCAHKEEIFLNSLIGRVYPVDKKFLMNTKNTGNPLDLTTLKSKEPESSNLNGSSRCFPDPSDKETINNDLSDCKPPDTTVKDKFIPKSTELSTNLTDGFPKTNLNNFNSSQPIPEFLKYLLPNMRQRISSEDTNQRIPLNGHLIPYTSQVNSQWTKDVLPLLQLLSSPVCKNNSYTDPNNMSPLIAQYLHYHASPNVFDIPKANGSPKLNEEISPNYDMQLSPSSSEKSLPKSSPSTSSFPSSPSTSSFPSSAKEYATQTSHDDYFPDKIELPKCFRSEDNANRYFDRNWPHSSHLSNPWNNQLELPLDKIGLNVAAIKLYKKCCSKPRFLKFREILKKKQENFSEERWSCYKEQRLKNALKHVRPRNRKSTEQHPYSLEEYFGNIPEDQMSPDTQARYKRFKNNRAAKKSRDLKRLKDLEQDCRKEYLETELNVTRQIMCEALTLLNLVTSDD